MRQLLLLRPEPGLAASAKRAQEMGLEVIACPLFQLESVTWQAPEPGRYEGLLLTSANAVRHGGPQLDKLKSIGVHAVGAATAAAAVEAGFKVETMGEGDVEDLLGSLPDGLRLLYLAGEDHRPLDLPLLDRQIVYRSAAIPDPGLPPLESFVVAIHSPRAGARLAELADKRMSTAIAAISKPAARAVGDGWERIEVAERPDDASLLALAAMLCHTSPRK